MPLLTTLNRVDLTINGSSTVNTKQITSYSYGTLRSTAGRRPTSAAWPRSALPTAGRRCRPGAGSILALPAYTTLQGATGYNDFHVNATGGGEVDLSKVTSQTGGRVQFYADGIGQHHRPVRAAPSSSPTPTYNSSIDAENGATVRMPPADHAQPRRPDRQRLQHG